MVDKVRSSDIIQGGYYEVNYNGPTFKVNDDEECRNACVSSLGCLTWRNLNGICSLSTENPQGKKFTSMKGASGGIVVSKEYVSIVSVIIFLIFLLFFGLALYRVLNII